MSKTRSDAKLKNRSEADQEKIYAWCLEPGGLDHAKDKCLAVLGVSTSKRALSEFFAWYELKLEYQEWDDQAKAQEDLLLRFDPKDTERARKYGEFVFTQRSLKAKDAKTFVGVGLLAEEKRKNDLRADDIKLRRDRFQFDAAAAALKHLPALRKIQSDKTLDSRGRVNAARQLLFGVTPE